MSVQANGTGRPELEELARRRPPQQENTRHWAGSVAKENPVLDEQWRKSSRSNNNGACVEVRQVGPIVEVRHSQRPDDGTIAFTAAEWTAFLGGVENGEFETA